MLNSDFYDTVHEQICTDILFIAVNCVSVIPTVLSFRPFCHSDRSVIPTVLSFRPFCHFDRREKS